MELDQNPDHRVEGADSMTENLGCLGTHPEDVGVCGEARVQEKGMNTSAVI